MSKELSREAEALGAFLAAMHDSKLDGAKMREAMLSVLGLAPQPTASTAGEREALFAKIDAAFRVVSDLCDGKRNWTMSVPARPDEDPDLVIAGALSAARAALASKPPAGEQKPIYIEANLPGGPGEWRRIAADQVADYEASGWTVRYLVVAQPEQVAQDKIDAERYRWLRAHNDPNDFGVSFAYPIDSDWRPALDVAIDAARARGEGERS